MDMILMTCGLDVDNMLIFGPYFAHIFSVNLKGRSTQSPSPTRPGARTVPTPLHLNHQLFDHQITKETEPTPCSLAHEIQLLSGRLPLPVVSSYRVPHLK